GRQPKYMAKDCSCGDATDNLKPGGLRQAVKTPPCDVVLACHLQTPCEVAKPKLRPAWIPLLHRPEWAVAKSIACWWNGHDQSLDEIVKQVVSHSLSCRE